MYERYNLRKTRIRSLMSFKNHLEQTNTRYRNMHINFGEKLSKEIKKLNHASESAAKTA